MPADVTVQNFNHDIMEVESQSLVTSSIMYKIDIFMVEN